MRKTKSPNAFQSLLDNIYLESVRRGPAVTFLAMAIVSGGVAWLIYSYLIEPSVVTNREYRQDVARKELENKKTETMLASEPQFRAQFKKVVDLYDEAKPLLPEETEVSEVLSQVEAAAQRNNVTLTGLQAVKQSVKATATAEKLCEREIPSVVTGAYPQVVRFFDDVSRMPRILLIRDYSIDSQKNNAVSAGFTLMAYHAPPPAEMPALPKDLALLNQESEKR
jgi:Tfp pilus assembly protein PilO